MVATRYYCEQDFSRSTFLNPFRFFNTFFLFFLLSLPPFFYYALSLFRFFLFFAWKLKSPKAEKKTPFSLF